MKKLQNLIKVLKNIETIVQDTFDETAVSSVIISLSKEKLSERGESASGKKLRTDKSFKYNTVAYSPFTQRLKRIENKPIYKVTLEDTGDFYRSLKLDSTSLYLVFSANTQKDNGKIHENFSKIFGSEEEFNAEVLPPQEKDYPKIRQVFLTIFKKKLRDAIL